MNIRALTRINHRIGTACASRISAVLFLLLIVCVAPGHARGFTSEESARNAIVEGRYPLTLSPDGRWRAHVDTLGVIHLVSLADARLRHGVIAKPSASAISLSARADKLAYLDSDGVNVVDMSGKPGIEPQRMLWTTCDGLKLTHAPCEPGKQSATIFDAALSASGGSLALAVHGAALEASSIYIIDLTTHRTIARVPAGYPLLNMRFVDADRKLLMVQARFGEVYEGNEWFSQQRTSDLQFVLWDIAQGEPHNIHAIDLGPWARNLHWAMAEQSGELWTVLPEDVGYPYPKRRKVRSVPFKACGPYASDGALAPRQIELAAQGTWLALAADPHGRWIAVSVASDLSEPGSKASLMLFNADNGRLLAQWRSDDDLGALTPSADGMTLYATTYPPPVVSGRKREGGGELRQFSFANIAARLPKRAPAAWTQEKCLIEDEAPTARDITRETRAPRRLFTLERSALLPTKLPEWHAACAWRSGGGSYGDWTPPWWGLTADGELWADAGASVVRLDLHSGRVLERLPTPRSLEVCSIVLPTRKQFLNFQGDTVTLRWFAPVVRPQDRQVLAHNPGWRADRVFYEGGRMVIRWADARNAAKPRTAWRGLYDIDKGELLARHVEAGENDDGCGPTGCNHPMTLFKGHRQTHYTRLKQPGYSATTSYLGSLRVWLNEAGQTRTVLWDGLKRERRLPQTQNGDRGDYDTFALVHDLGDGVFAQVRQRRYLALYDAPARRRSALIDIDGAGYRGGQHMTWDEATRTLLVSCGAEACQLQAYRVP